MLRSATVGGRAPTCGAPVAVRRPDVAGKLIARSRPCRLVDLVECAAIREVRLLRLLPVAEIVLELEQCDLGELLVVFLRNGVECRTVEIACSYFLSLRRVQVFEVRLRNGTRAFLVDDLVDQRDRRLGENADRWDDDLHLVLAELLDRKKRLVLPGDQDIADAALGECRGRTTRA